jgi:hypothetical protein
LEQSSIVSVLPSGELFSPSIVLPVYNQFNHSRSIP